MATEPVSLDTSLILPPPPPLTPSPARSLTLSLSDFSVPEKDKTHPSPASMLFTTSIRPSPFNFTLLSVPKWVENKVPKTTIFFSDLFTPVKKDSATERPPLLDFDVGADDELCVLTLSLPYSKDQFDEHHEEKPSVAHLNNFIGKGKRFLNSKKPEKGGVKKRKLGAEKTKTITNAQTKIKTEPLDAVNVPEFMDKWKIKKRLSTSDINRSRRLLLPRKQVIEHVLPLMDKSMIEECQKKSGKEVIVWDVDTDSRHDIVFKQWKDGKTFVLVSNWKDDFVIRRNLRINDEVGLLWNQITSMFYFSVINKN